MGLSTIFAMDTNPNTSQEMNGAIDALQVMDQDMCVTSADFSDFQQNCKLRSYF